MNARAACSRESYYKSISDATVVFLLLSSSFSSCTTLPLRRRVYPPTFRATATAKKPVLIAVASWDSPSVVVFYFPAPPAGNVAQPQAGIDSAQRTADPSKKKTTVAEELASWLPPWGDSAGAAAAVGARGGGATILTRALAFVRCGKGPERMSLVAATGDGAVAVAAWQETRIGERPGREPKEKNILRGRFVSVASFQIGQGSVRLETFQSPDRTGLGQPAQERLFVNGNCVDAVLYYLGSDATEGAAPDECRDGWRCTQVSVAICAAM